MRRIFKCKACRRGHRLPCWGTYRNRWSKKAAKYRAEKESLWCECLCPDQFPLPVRVPQPREA